MTKLYKKFIIDKRVINFNVDENENWVVECINVNSAAEEILDTLRENLDKDKYKFGIKTYASYWKEKTSKETLIVYAKRR
jgi:hypothetical protein